MIRTLGRSLANSELSAVLMTCLFFIHRVTLDLQMNRFKPKLLYQI